MSVTPEIAQAKRNDYMSHAITHQEYYLWIAEELGMDAVKRAIPFSPEQVKIALESDVNLNNLQLQVWDRQDYIVRSLAGRAGFPAWSLSDTVCTLKAVARATAES